VAYDTNFECLGSHVRIQRLSMVITNPFWPTPQHLNRNWRRRATHWHITSLEKAVPEMSGAQPMWIPMITQVISLRSLCLQGRNVQSLSVRCFGGYRWLLVSGLGYDTWTTWFWFIFGDGRWIQPPGIWEKWGLKIFPTYIFYFEVSNQIGKIPSWLEGSVLIERVYVEPRYHT